MTERPPGGTPPPQPPAAPPPPPPPPPPAAAPPASLDLAALTSRFLPAELLVLAGALILLGTEIVFWWLLLQEGVGDSVLLLAVSMLTIVLLQRTGQADFGHRYTTALLVLGAALGFLIVDDFVVGIRAMSAVGLQSSLLVSVLVWLGGAVAVVGAFMLWRPGMRPRA
jgi:hypothetical protein